MTARRRPGLWPVLFACLSGCGPAPDTTVLEFWAMGREAEAVRTLLPAFEQRHPGLTVEVQSVPWSAAHEKLLTAYAGDALPDLFQLGNTWIPEFVALDAIEPLDDRLGTDATHGADFFEGILATYRIGGRRYGLPWYVDTRLLFYRTDLLAQAGFPEPPRTWTAWRKALDNLKARPGGEHYALLLPVNEWQVPALLGLQLGAELLRDGDRYGNFQSPAFRKAFGFYLALFREGYAPAVAEAQIANLYQEFAQGFFTFYITGPWNLGEFERRLPASLQGRWATAPLPAPEERGEQPGLSLAGGAGLAIARSARHPAEAYALIEFLTEPATQAAFYRLTGNLPARRAAWDDPALSSAEPVRAFRRQLERVAATPKIPEWERIAAKLAHYAERAVRGELSEDEALARLDADVDRILEKRRWLLKKERRTGG
jgi:multiple sugar transport system substrate-binding protein